MSGKKMISSEIKRFNRSNIYQQFLCHEALTKQNLVSNLQLCLPTVAKKHRRTGGRTEARQGIRIRRDIPEVEGR